MNDVAKISKNEMIKGGTKLNLVQRVTSEFKTIQDYLKKRKWQKKNKWMGLYPGDLVEIDGRYYLYMGVNPMGGPGMPGMAEPSFTTAYPTNPQLIYYFRPTQLSNVFPMNVFSEEIPPYDVSGTSTKIAFINGTNIKKFGHLTREEWITGEYIKMYARRYEEFKKRLEGKKTKQPSRNPS